VGPSRKQLLFVLQQLLQLLLVQRRELLVDPSAVGQPLADRLVQGAGEVEQRPLAAVVDCQIQGMVQLAFLAAASRFAAGAGPIDQRAPQERLLGEQLGELGACVAFWGRSVGAVCYGASGVLLTTLLYAQKGRRRQARRRMRICSPQGAPP